MSEERVLLGTAEFNEAQRIKTLLAGQEINVETAHNPSSCTSGCRVTLEIWAQKSDLEAIGVFFKAEHSNLMKGLDYDASLLEEVFDPTKAEAKCPACGTNFATSLGECPDCGLVFSLPEA